MDYISHIPAPPLNTYIYDLYHIDGQSPYPRLKVSPDAMLHLMVNLGQPFEVCLWAESSCTFCDL
jgi:hypothetical protein